MCSKSVCWERYLAIKRRKWQNEETCLLRSFTICTSHQISLGRWNQERGHGHSMQHVWGRKLHARFWSENLKKTDQFEALSVHVRVKIKMDLQEIRCKGVNWINLAQNRNKWWAVVNRVKYLPLPLPQPAWNCLTGWQTASPEGPDSTESVSPSVT